MRTDKYMMAKAWMKQDQAPQSEALETWNTLEAEFNEERKAMLMASAESDKIKAMMNEKYGPGTMKYGSEIPQPEIKTPQAAFEFSQRNPAAEGGRMGFLSGGDVEKIIKIYKAGSEGNYRTSANFIANKIGKKFGSVSKSSVGKKLAELFADGTLTKQEEIKSSKVDGKRKIYKVIREITNQDRITNPDIPKNAKFKVQLPGKTGVEMKYASTKNILQKAIDASDDYVENILPSEISERQIGNKSGFKPGNKVGLQFGSGQKSAITPEMIKLNTDIIDEIAKTKILDVRTLADTFDMSLKDMNQKLTNFVRQYYYNRIGTGGVYLNKYDDSFLSDVLGKINKSDFQNQYERTMNELVSKSYPKGSKNLTAALDNLKNYHKTNKLIAEKFPSLYSTLDHSVPYTYIRDITEAGSNPKNLIKVRPIPQEANTFKTLIDRRSIDLGKKLKVNPKDAELLKNFKDLNFIKKSIPLEFGTTTSTGKVVSYANQALSGKTDLVEGIVKGNAQFNELIDFSKNLDPKSDLAKLLTKSEKTQLSKISTITKVDDKELKQIIRSIGCPNGVLEASSGGNCLTKGTELINNGMKGASPAALKNLAKLGPMLLKTGSAVMSGLIVPEALIVGLETAARVGLGDTPSEAILRATDYLTPDSFFGDFMQKADLMKLERTLGKDVANIAAQSFDRTNQSDKINKLEEKLKNLEAMTESGDFGYVGDLTNQINMTKDQIKQEKNKLKNTTQIGQEGRDLFTERALEDSYDASMAKSKFAAKKLMDSQSQNPRISATQAMQDMKPQEQLNKKQLPQRMLKGSAGEQAFLNLSQLPKGPRQGSEIDDLVTASNANFKSMGSDRRVDSSLLKYVQDLKQKEKDMSIADMVNVYGAESILGTQGNMGQPVERTGPGYMTNYKPLNRFGSQQRPVLYPKGRGQLAEGGITGLRSKYEYKK